MVSAVEVLVFLAAPEHHVRRQPSMLRLFVQRLTRPTVAPYDQWQSLGGGSLIDHNNLEEFADPHNYDIEDNSDTGIAFYTALAQETGDPILEIACGTGRVTIPIAQLGLAVTSLDIVPGMLERARSKSAGTPRAVK